MTSIPIDPHQPFDRTHQPPPIEAVIFDCDGTLVDSEPLGFESIIEHASAHGATFDLPELAAMKGQSMRSYLATVAARLDKPLPDDYEATLRERMAATFRARLQPMPGAADMLARLKIPYCVASNGPRSKIELTLGITGMLDRFGGRIYSAYEVGSFKPDPGLFLYAANAMGVPPERCAVVEDSVSGVKAGLAAGMAVYVLRSAEPLPAELASKVHAMDHLAELIEALHPPA